LGGPAVNGAARLNQGLVVGGAVLIGLGGLMGLTGALLLSSAVVAATRRWIRQLERPPTEIARLKFQQARAATSAGASAWRGGPPAHGSDS
jgi:hypothetical protein